MDELKLVEVDDTTQERLTRAERMQQSEFRPDIDRKIERVLVRFFRGKRDRLGRKFRTSSDAFRDEVLNDENIEYVRDTCSEDAFIRFYDEIVEPEPSKRGITYLVAAMHECARLRIPKIWVPGICAIHAAVVGKWFGPLEPYEEETDEDDGLPELLDAVA